MGCGASGSSGNGASGSSGNKADVGGKLKNGINTSDAEAVKAAIDSGVDVNEICEEAQWKQPSLLHQAINAYASPLMETKDMAIIKLLLDAKANINFQPSFDGKSPLHEAVTEYLPEIAKLLIEAKADVNSQAKADVTQPPQTPLDMLVVGKAMAEMSGKYDPAKYDALTALLSGQMSGTYDPANFR